jgi:hypothetical protein
LVIYEHVAVQGKGLGSGHKTLLYGNAILLRHSNSDMVSQMTPTKDSVSKRILKIVKPVPFKVNHVVQLNEIDDEYSLPYVCNKKICNSVVITNVFAMLKVVALIVRDH